MKKIVPSLIALLFTPIGLAQFKFDKQPLCVEQKNKLTITIPCGYTLTGRPLSEDALIKVESSGGEYGVVFATKDKPSKKTCKPSYTFYVTPVIEGDIIISKATFINKEKKILILKDFKAKAINCK